MSFKVQHLSIRRLRNILDVSFEFDPNLIKISGENGAGKSTVVDAIFLSIVGKTYIGRGRSAEHLITKNQENAEIECTLSSTGRTLKITRSISKNGDVKLDIISSDGAKLQQRDLDELLSEFTIDPLAFTKLSKKEQYDIVKQISGVDTGSIDAEIQTQEQKTQGIRAVAKIKSGALKDHGYREKVERVDFAELVTELGALKNTVNEFETKQKDVITLEGNLDRYDREIAEIQNKIGELKKLKEIDQEKWMIAKSGVSQDADAYNDARNRIADINEKSRQANEINAKAEEYTTYSRLVSERDASEKELKENEELLESIRDRRKKIIEAGKMPVEGLNFDEAEGVLLNGLPIDQLSSAQQLLLACKIATSQNPMMKVIYIKDGSLLDKHSMEEIEKVAENEDYQIFIERVGEEVDSIIMRDGASV